MKDNIFIISLLVVMLFLFSGCGSKSLNDSMVVDSEKQILCPEKREQVCTMDYNPVCGGYKDGKHKTYSNGCSACADVDVVSYQKGICE